MSDEPRKRYKFVGLECQIGKDNAPGTAVLRQGDTIELTAEEYRNAAEGGAALVPDELEVGDSPRPTRPKRGG